MDHRQPLTADSFVVALEGCGPADLARVGGKAVGLGRLMQHRFPVPAGFAVTTDAYRAAIEHGGLAEAIAALLADVDETADNSTIAERIQAHFRDLAVPEPIAAALRAAYGDLADGEDVPVAVRSSATAEDTEDASFAGQQDTYLWIQGADSVIEHVVRCWASLFTARAIGYRARFDVDEADLAMGVVVQRMVPADAAGVLMTLDPVSGDRSEIYIESSLGLGEAIVRGDVDPDRITLDKQSLRPLRFDIGTKEIAHRHDAGAVRALPTSPEERAAPSLSDALVTRLGELGRRVESAFGVAVDVEWAVADDAVYLVQARPETVWSHKHAQAAPVLSDPLSGPADSRCPPNASPGAFWRENAPREALSR